MRSIWPPGSSSKASGLSSRIWKSEPAKVADHPIDAIIPNGGEIPPDGPARLYHLDHNDSETTKLPLEPNFPGFQPEKGPFVAILECVTSKVAVWTLLTRADRRRAHSSWVCG
jgi:hypothetical protein